MVTVTRLTSRAPEPEGGGGAGVAHPAHHQGLALAAAVVLVAHGGVAPGVVAVARPVPGALEREERDGVEQTLTLLGHGPSPPRLGHEEKVSAA